MRAPSTRPPLFAIALLAVLSVCLAGCQTSLSAEVKGSTKPRTVSCTPGERIETPNGDFTIVQKCVSSDNLIVGDGISESTYWAFDLSDEDVAACYPESALVEMRLRPTGDLLGEVLRVQGRWAMGLEEIQSLEIGYEQTIELDMMIRNGRPSPYGPGEIRDLLLQEPEGVLPMVYELNALVSYAKLTVHCRK